MTEPTPSSTSGLSAPDLLKFKHYLINTISRELNGDDASMEKRAKIVKKQYQDIYGRSNVQLPEVVRQQIYQEVLDELLGYGPIQNLLEDPEIDEVMVNGYQKVYVERKGKLTKTPIKFENDDHVQQIIDRIILPLGRRIDIDNPTVDARLPDGSRVNAIIPPVAIDGPSITIRKFRKEKLTIAQLIEYGSITEGSVEFLRACVLSRLNIVISGGTGSGKTTLLNVLSGYIPEDDRIITIEDAAELQLRQEHVVRLETKTPNIDGRGAVTTRDLVRNSLRMRPDRIVVGEVRSGEALDMLQAMNTGHDGSMTTVHANNPRDSISRMETLVLMAGIDLPIKVIRQQIASAIDLIIQLSRLKDGTRKVTAITEVAGMEGDTVVLTDVFRFEQTGRTEDGKIIGMLKPTGIRPLFSPRLEAAGFKLGAAVFSSAISDRLAAGKRRR